MRVLVIGSSGFIGRQVTEELSKNHKVYKTSRHPDEGEAFEVDLMDKKSISEVLDKVQPEAIVNCAGVVENSDAATANIQFTKNLLDAVLGTRLEPKAIIICGSAAEYGEVKVADIPVRETVPLNAENKYGTSKKLESELALEYKKKYRLPVTIVRIFNPMGFGMHPKFLISGITRQVHEIEEGKRSKLEVSRLDSKRDYVDVTDVAEAVRMIIEGSPKRDIYNIGSGISTSNGEIIDLALKYSNLKSKPPISETFPEPEPVYAIQADISRIKDEFGWEPRHSIEDTVKKAMDDARRS